MPPPDPGQSLGASWDTWGQGLVVPPCPGGIGRLGPWLAVGGVQQGTLGCPRAGRLLWPPPPPGCAQGML